MTISPCSATISTVRDSAAASTSVPKTRAPSRSITAAVARPLPQPSPTDPAPKISAVLPCSRPMRAPVPRARLSGGRCGANGKRIARAIVSAGRRASPPPCLRDEGERDAPSRTGDRNVGAYPGHVRRRRRDRHDRQRAAAQRHRHGGSRPAGRSGGRDRGQRRGARGDPDRGGRSRLHERLRPGRARRVQARELPVQPLLGCLREMGAAAACR